MKHIQYASWLKDYINKVAEDMKHERSVSLESMDDES